MVMRVVELSITTTFAGCDGQQCAGGNHPTTWARGHKDHPNQIPVMTGAVRHGSAHPQGRHPTIVGISLPHPPWRYNTWSKNKVVAPKGSERLTSREGSSKCLTLRQACLVDITGLGVLLGPHLCLMKYRMGTPSL